MSHLLWKYYWENDVDKFRRLLAPAGYSQTPSKPSKVGVGNPPAFGSSPRVVTKLRKTSGHGSASPTSKNVGSHLGRADINSRDHSGLTILLRAASSTSANAIAFVEAILDHPSVDIYVEDPESGWNALHRALYHGNISIARLLLEKERKDLTESLGASNMKIGQLIKTKDHEGNSPFDVYNATIALRTLKIAEDRGASDDQSVTDDGASGDDSRPMTKTTGFGDEVFTFGSNNNLSLGLGDEDDRQFPERIYLKRPAHLIHHFHDEYLKNRRHLATLEDSMTFDPDEVPTLVRHKPLLIQDVVLSKLHSAILTADPISNLYICGIGRGGRLGMGDENTRFTFVPVQGGLVDKKVVQVALGQNHTMAITSDGELWTWGLNVHSQLGYALPTPSKPEEEPMSTTPRQVFGPLKKEVILGAAASSLHSVAHTGSALFCWGKNVGQLALMDADSRSLEVQTVPRRVAATLLSSHSSIVMVSAIDRATCCLFEDHTVCVFTSYGYKIIRFPFQDAFSNSSLQRSGQFTMTAAFDPRRREIHSLTSGGDTIAAVTGTGDLFTMALNLKSDGSQTATSTTNPVKIQDAVTTPHCVWNSNKDGVKSVSVGENGSVIIATQSGTVWRRVKRTKAKDTKVLGAFDFKRKDFKFQRVPYITDIVAVRASAFGAHAAIRKDCDVTRDQIEIAEPTLWDDISPLFPLAGFKASNHKRRENKDTWKFQDPDYLKTRVDTFAFEVLTSTDLEDDLKVHVRDRSFSHEGLDTVIRLGSIPDISIPVHSWILSARSPVLRAGLQRFRENGEYELQDSVSITEENGVTVVELAGSVDIITLVNIVEYVYSDQVIPAWSFTRQAPPLAYRYRQIRADLMKLATRLGMTQLETAVRLQNTPSHTMDQDFKRAIEDHAFFEDGDALLELDGDEIPAHSTLLCQRCPWFQGLFNGRSGGMWLAGRRAAQDETDRIPIDLKHMDPESFHYVLQHLYGDVGEDLFDEVVVDSIDDFSELVMDVMGIANELMLDRLSQICQKVIGRFVTTRNISTLLNLVSPCSVTEFKNKGLEYICLQMELMLENHLLDDLDEDLLLELDDVVRDNQLARCPFARSGRAELLLHERNPGLVQDIDEERQIRVREMAFKSAYRDDERKLSSSFKTRFGSLEDFSNTSPTAEKSRRKSKTVRNEPFSPALRPKDSRTELIFDMDDDEIPVSPSPRPRPVHSNDRDGFDQIPSPSEPRQELYGRTAEEFGSPIASPHSPALRAGPTSLRSSTDPKVRRTSHGTSPWGHSNLPTSRLDLREVLAESKPAQSALSAGLEAAKKDAVTRPAAQKMSQKEKKKYLQQQAEHAAREESKSGQQSQTPWSKVGERKESPWQTTASIPKTKMQDVLGSTPTPPSGLANSKPLIAAEASSSKSVPRRTASPDTRFSGQRTRKGTPASKPPPPSSMSPAASSSQPVRPDTKPLVPHSKSYITRAPMRAEQELGVGLADIIGQQQREQQDVREAVAKRSLQEIQQEQAFQEWWDQESRRMQEEEARRGAKEEAKERKGGSARRGRGKGKDKGGKGGSKGESAGAGSGNSSATASATASGSGSGAASGSSRGRVRGSRGGKGA
ncbi:hypothetical protein F4778DRAFT_796432 [Xylariomycetidae sp. FL2044]|nr:hypothetical protein F4778DRAFT_796432 [Xylariomycetidae sp. FL2044]